MGFKTAMNAIINALPPNRQSFQKEFLLENRKTVTAVWFELVPMPIMLETFRNVIRF